MLFCRKLRVCTECGVAFKPVLHARFAHLCQPHRIVAEDKAARDDRVVEWIRGNIQRFDELYKHSLNQEYRMLSDTRHSVLMPALFPEKVGVWVKTYDYETLKERECPKNPSK